MHYAIEGSCGKLETYMKKIYTLGFLLKENAICLALKKRGFGVRQSGRLSQDLEQFLRKVYSPCKGGMTLM